MFRFSVLAILLFLSSPLSAQLEMGSAFTHQGSLREAGAPANGVYDFRFALFTDISAGSQVGSLQTVNNVTVVDGIYSTPVDFGFSVFDGQELWLEISVKADASGSYTSLSPRRELTPVPYALFAAKAQEAVTAETATSADTAVTATSATSATTATTAGSATTADSADLSARLESTYVTVGDDSNFGEAVFEGSASNNVVITNEGTNVNVGRISILDDDSDVLLELTALPASEIGYVETRGPNGNDNVVLTAVAGNNNHGAISIFDDEGVEVVDISSTPNFGGNVAVFDDTGNVNGVLDSNFGGRLSLYSEFGNLNIEAEPLAANNLHGYFGVFDSFGNAQSGLFVNTNGDGIVFADFTSFSNEPELSSKGTRYIYGAPIGNEVAVYSRGKVDLVDGKANIELEDSFLTLANLNTATVHVTPSAASSLGLAARIEKDHLIVEELANGSGNYSVSYYVIAERSDVSDFKKVYGDKSAGDPFSNGPRSEKSANEHVPNQNRD